MKKLVTLLLVSVFMICFLVAGPCFAASSMVVTQSMLSHNGNAVLLKVVCTAHTDGTFDNKEINEAAASAGMARDYWKMGYTLSHAWAVNSATDDHTNAAVVTITDETGQVIIGAASGDTLTLSQTASAKALMVADRASAQRSVTSKLTIAIADTGSTATVQTLYLLLRK